MNDTTWIWTSPNGRITHNYKPQQPFVMLYYLHRGWTATCGDKDQAEVIRDVLNRVLSTRE